MNYNDTYQFMLKNIVDHMKRNTPLESDDNMDAFRFSEVLSVALCKRKEDVIMDIINKVKNED